MIEDIYTEALLSAAAYANWSLLGTLDEAEIKAELIDHRGFTEKQYETFFDPQNANRLYDIYQGPSVGYTEDLNGFSATIFQERATGKLTVAFRGTQPKFPQIQDFLTDISALLGNPGGWLEFFNQTNNIDHFLANNNLVSGGQLIQPVNFTGHSLGGYLSIMAAYKYSSSFGEAYTYNGLGLNPFESDEWEQLKSIFDGQPLDATKVHNYFADKGWEGASNPLLSRPGGQERIFIEYDGPLDDITFANHGINKLVESLSVYRVLALLDPSLDDTDAGFDKIYTILDAATNAADQSLETIVEQLGNLLGGTLSIQGNKDDIELFYQEVVAKGATFNIDIIPSGSIANLAAQDTEAGRGYRYSLVNLLPFVITSNLAVTAANDSKYDIENFSDEYLSDKTYVLSKLLNRNISDDDYANKGSEGNEIYRDLGADVAFSNAALPTNAKYYIFGGESDDSGPTIDGFTQDDRLYGGGGDDTIIGGDGNDYIEGNAGNDTLYGEGDRDTLYGGKGEDHLHGGKGNDVLSGGADSVKDTYHYTTGDGNDLIIDADLGGDRIEVDGIDLATLAFKQVAVNSNIYKVENQDLSILVGPGEAALSIAKDNNLGTIKLQSFSIATGSTFGIKLEEDPVEEIAPTNNEELVTNSDGPGRYVTANAGDDQRAGQFPNGILYHTSGYYDDATVTEAYAHWAEWVQQGKPEGFAFKDYGAKNFKGFSFSGSVNSDRLYGSQIADGLLGLDDDDVIKGEGGVDLLAGGRGSDQVYGGEGNDTVIGAYTAGHDGSVFLDNLAEFRDPDAIDYLEGNAGSDYLIGSRSIDIISGGTESDAIGGGLNSDTLSGDEGNDLILGDSTLVYQRAYDSVLKQDVVRQGIYGDQDNSANLSTDDIIDGGSGEDVLLGEFGSDVISGGADNDIIFGDRNNQVALIFPLIRSAFSYEFPTGFNTVLNLDLTTLETKAELHGNDVIDAGDGNDYVEGNGGDDVITGGLGNDKIQGDDFALAGNYHGTDIVYGGAGVDQITGDGGDDILYGGAGGDTIDGDNGGLDGQYHGNDTLYGGADADTLIGNGGADELHGGEGDDIITGDAGGLAEQYHGNDFVYGDEGNDTLFGQGGADLLFGGENDDELYGGNDDDKLYGGSGGDHLYGGDGNDVLVGGTGVDFLYGEGGDDTYEFGRGDGAAAIDDTDGVNLIKFKAGIGLADITVSQQGAHSYIYYSADRLDYVQFTSPSFQKISNVQFADGTTASLQKLIESSASGVDVAVGDSADNILFGGAGNDRLDGLGGNDLLYGGNGHDILEGGECDDKLYGQGGNDLLKAAGGADELYGGEGNDSLYAGSGNTYLAGGLGDDVYHLENETQLNTVSENPDEGYDTIVSGLGLELPDNFEKLVGGGNYNYNILLIGNDLDNVIESRTWAGDYLDGKAGADFLIGGQGDNTYVIDNDGDIASEALGDGHDVVRSKINDFRLSYGIEELWLESGVSYGLGNNSDNILVGRYTAASATLEGGRGDDLYQIQFGQTVIESQDAGQDTLELYDAGDRTHDFSMISNVENFVLKGATWGTLVGNDLDNHLKGNDRSGYHYSDILIGGLGNDNLEGGAGHDTYRYAVGDGRDVIIDAVLTNASDTLELDNAIQLSDLTFELHGLDLKIVINDADQIRIKNWGVRGLDVLKARSSVDSIKVNDGGVVVTLSTSDIEALATTPIATDDEVTSNGSGGYVTEDQQTVLTFADLLNNDSGNGLTILGVSNSVNGVAEINHLTQIITFTPEQNFYGTASFDYTVSDGSTQQKAAVRLDVKSYNDITVAVDDNVVSESVGPITINAADLLSNDIDPDSELLLSQVFSGVNGEVSIDIHRGVITFTPDEGYTGAASFGYYVEDGRGTWSDDRVGTVNLQIGGNNSAPVAVEDTAVVLNVADLLNNDTDLDGDTLSITAVNNASNGTVSLDAQADTITFTPNANYSGPASFDYTLSDGTANDTGTVNLTITAVNDAPVAVNDVATTGEDTALILNVADLLSNDSDVDGDALSITAVSNAANGTVVLDAVAGTVTFTPADGYSGPASFDYTLSDGTESTTGNIAINVTGATNSAPVVADDAVNAVEDSALVINAADLTSNDSDVDGDALSITSVSGAVNGSVVLDTVADTITFTPDANYNGTASFDYTVSDGTASDTGTVNLTISSVNDSPVAVNDATTTVEDTAVVLNVTDLLSNDSDVDGDSLSITTVSNAANGAAALDTVAGTITFTPTEGYSGPASFDYTLSDGSASTTGSVAINVTEVANTAPEATDDAVNTNEDSPLVINVADLLSNDTDAQGDSLAITSVDNAANGSVILDAVAGTITFTPDANYHGPASFDYTLTDGELSDTGTVNVTVAAANDQPVASDDTGSTAEDTAVLISMSELLRNDTDLDGDTLSITGVTNAQNGVVSLDAQVGTIAFTPNANYNGPASFDYTVSDGISSDTGTVNLTIIAVNDAPVAVDETATTLQDTAIVLNVADLLSNDSDVDGDTVSITAVSNAANGTSVLDILAGTITFTPNAGYSGSASFDYTLSDGNGTSNAQVNLTITPAPTGQIIEGTNSSDTLIGAAGNDTFVLGKGSDVLSGAAGDDVFQFTAITSGSKTYDGGEGHDIILGTSADDTIKIRSLTNIEAIDGGEGYNKIQLSYSSSDILDASNITLTNIDELSGHGDRSTIIGSVGDDYIVGGTGNDNLQGGAGNDTFSVTGTTHGTDHFNGGAGYDMIVGSAGNDTIGIRSLTGIEAIDGGDGYDILTMRHSSTNVLDVSNVALTSIEELNGNGDHITIIGTAGDDYIVGGTGDDNLQGGAGDDTFTVTGTGHGSDHFNGGDGHDTIVGSAGDDTIGIRSLTGIEAIDGDDGYDILTMRYSSIDVLDVSNVALMGIEELNGDGDHITIIGSTGDDRINGGNGNDTLTGGEGSDTYLFNLGDDSDTIQNQSASFTTDTDKLELSGITHDQLWFSQTGNDLTIDYIGSNDQIRIDDWYLGDAYELDEAHASGQVLLANQVDQLVAAMASFSAGEPTSLDDLSTQQQTDLNTAIAVAWKAA